MIHFELPFIIIQKPTTSEENEERPMPLFYVFPLVFDLIKKFNSWQYYSLQIFLKKKRDNLFITFYSNILLQKKFFGLRFFNIMHFANNNQLILINNKTNQLHITLLRNTKFLISFSTGVILYYLQIFQKKLKRQIKSFVLQVKVLANLINTLYKNDWLIINLKGTKKNFFKWLNVLKYNLSTNKTLIHIYTPSIFYKPIKIKKIKSIKRKFKKEYLYSEML